MKKFDLEHIKSIPIATVAADLGFNLTARGVGRCRLPGHEDKRPSFTLRARGNGFRCFACQRYGSVVDLVMTMLAIEFHDACRWLSDRYLDGIINRAHPIRRSSLSAAPEIADSGQTVGPDPEVYRWVLDQSSLQPEGRTYLKRRAISDTTLAHFRIGQVGNREALFHKAIDRFGIARLELAGIVLKGRTGPRFVFPSGYLLFPFLQGGSVIYLQARRADGGERYRWCCPIKLLPTAYNLDVLEGNAPTITICEGITDVLSAHELSMVPIGLLGAARDFDSQIIERLVGRNVAIFGDADRPGSAFAQRLRRRLAARGITVAVKHLPTGINDLNDYLLSRRMPA